MAKMAASNQFANVQFPMRKLRNLTLVQFFNKSTQYATKNGVKIFKGKTASQYLLVYLETVQKATVSTAGTGKLIGTLNYKRMLMITE